MKNRWMIVLVIFASFLLLSAINSETRAASGQFAVYLPVIVHGGPAWREVGAGSASGGGISNNISTSWQPSFAIAPDGIPYAAWVDNSDIYVRTWNGSSWAVVGASSASGGGISNTAGNSYSPSIAIGPDGTPYIAWEDDTSGNSEIYIRSWNGSNWVEVGTGSASGGGISNNAGTSAQASLALAPDGTLYVAWDDISGGQYQIYVRAWNGSNWVEVGAGSASGTGISINGGFIPSIGVAPDGTPYVTWHRGGANTEIYVRKWDGAGWVEVGAGSASGGGISNNTGISDFPCMVISANGTPYIAWRDNSSGNFEIFLRTWNGSSWVTVGASSASGGGISNTNGTSLTPNIGLAPDGSLYAAWTDDAGGNYDIYVLRWNGSNWVEVGVGSASGGGISKNAGASFSPNIVVAPDGTPYVAWEDSSSPDAEIYVLRYME